ncbi:PP2C family protein-serine/threonine phosphatase [Streptomyces sp. CA-106131]|uniref:PP2C family protein-serine/threonine phosphatase n=1 Tax=Streptomyces sp. CA-106131 TaxID=3240045 RepID=UPI003D934FB8
MGIELSPAHAVYTGPVLAAMPALASLVMGPRGTILAAVGALAVTALTAALHHTWGGLVYSNLLAALLVSIASVTMSSLMRTRRQAEFDQVRRIAAAIQRVLLRPVPARVGPVRMACMYLAAETGAQIGGDFYEAVPTRYGVRVIMGDVRGKGLPAVRSAAAVLGAFREAAHYEGELEEVMNHCAAALNRECAMHCVCDENGDEERLGEGREEDEAEEFATALVVQVGDEFVVQVVNRGHPPPLLLRGGKMQHLAPTSPLPPLGMEGLMTEPPVKVESYSFRPGDRLLLHTDGVIEARNPDNDFFPLPEAVEAAAAACTPPELLQHLHLGLIRHTEGSLADDVAMLVVDRLDEEASEPVVGRAVGATTGQRRH